MYQASNYALSADILGYEKSVHLPVSQSKRTLSCSFIFPLYSFVAPVK